MISAVILAYNEEGTIERSLERISSDVGEIIVVDSYSSDATASIAASYGAEVHQHEWKGYADAWEFGFEQASGEWILQLGADEVPSEELLDKLHQIDEQDGEHNGYEINRINYTFGKPVNHWNNWAPIFFRPEFGQMTERSVNEHIQLEGEWKRIDAPLHHYTYESVSEHFEKIDRYTCLEVEEIDQCPSSTQRYGSPVWETFKLLFIDRLILDGADGIYIAIMSGLYEYVSLHRAWLAYTGREEAATDPHE